MFITERDVPVTNNVSERALRPSVIFRKVTNGFRFEWAAQTYAALRSVVSIAKANRRSVLDDFRAALATDTNDRQSRSQGEQLPFAAAYPEAVLFVSLARYLYPAGP